MLEIVACDAPFGAEIHGLDGRAISAQAIAICKQIQGEQGVIFFRDQHLSCEDHIAQAECFGEVVVSRFFEKVDAYSQIAMVRKAPTHPGSGG